MSATAMFAAPRGASSHLDSGNAALRWISQELTKAATFAQFASHREGDGEEAKTRRGGTEKEGMRQEKREIQQYSIQSECVTRNPTSPLGREWFSEPVFPSSSSLLPSRGGVNHCSLLINTPSPRRPGANQEPCQHPPPPSLAKNNTKYTSGQHRGSYAWATRTLRRNIVGHIFWLAPATKSPEGSSRSLRHS